MRKVEIKGRRRVSFTEYTVTNNELSVINGLLDNGKMPTMYKIKNKVTVYATVYAARESSFSLYPTAFRVYKDVTFLCVWDCCFPNVRNLKG